MDLVIPFNSIGGDRQYSADDIAEMYQSVISDGVHPSPGTCLQVTSAGGWNIAIAPGRCAIRGRLGVNHSAKTLTVSAPSGSLPRIDSVIIRYDSMARNLIEAIVQGTPAQAPAASALRRDQTMWELCLARILVKPTATMIQQSDITDTRQDGALCGVMHSLIEVDPAGLFAQYDDAWRGWFNAAKLNTADWQSAMYSQFENWVYTVRGLLDDNDNTKLAGAVANLLQSASQYASDRPGTLYEITREEGTVSVAQWSENTTLGLWQANITNESVMETGTDVAVVIAPKSLKQPILGAGETHQGFFTLFAARRPEEDVAYSLIVTGKRS